MKTIARLIIVAVIVLGAQSSHGSNPHPSVSVRVLDATSFAFYLKQIDGQKLHVSIKDVNGTSLYSTDVRNKSSFSRKVNLKELPEGNYSLEVSDNIRTVTYPIRLGGEVLKVPVEERIATFNPIFRKQDRKVALVLFSPSKQTHDLKIYNEANQLIHDEKIIETVNYQMQFDFSDALPGQYNFVINSQGHEYTYHLPVR